MTDTEVRELDRWLQWAGGTLYSWTERDGNKRHEARVRKDGIPLRVISKDGPWEAIKKLRERYETPSAPSAAAPKERCASCPAPAAEVFRIRCSDSAAADAGIKLTGPWVDTSWDGSPIREECVPLCPQCMASQLRQFVSGWPTPAYWLKEVRCLP